MGEGGLDGVGAKSNDGEKAWSPVNHSILSGPEFQVTAFHAGCGSFSLSAVNFIETTSLVILLYYTSSLGGSNLLHNCVCLCGRERSTR